MSLKLSGKFSQNRFSPGFHRPVNLLMLPGETFSPVGHQAELLELCSSGHMPRITWPWILQASLVYMKTFRNFNDFILSNNKTCKFFWSNIIYTPLFLGVQGGVFCCVLLTTILYIIFISPIYATLPTYVTPLIVSPSWEVLENKSHEVSVQKSPQVAFYT